MARKGRHRLTLDIPLGFYKDIKKIADRRGITMTRLLLGYIFRILKREDELRG